MDLDLDEAPSRDLLRSTMKKGVRMFLAIILGSSYCVYGMQNTWTPLPDKETTVQVSDVEQPQGTTGDSTTSGLFVAVDELGKVIDECWLHAKSSECMSTDPKRHWPCMMKGQEENNVLCIRLSPLDHVVASAIFRRTGEGFEWNSTHLMGIWPTKSKVISDLIELKFGTGCVLEKQVSFDGLHGDRIELHGFFTEFEFDDFRDIRFDDSFRTLQLMGEGSFGKVHRCTCLFDQNIYAVKKGQLRYGEPQEPSEVEALSVLNNENIVEFVCAWREKDRSNPSMATTYIVMQCCENSLQDILPLGQTEQDAKNELFEQLAASIYYSHRKGVINRDVKPPNILLVDKIVKLADFGHAALKTNSESSFHGGKYGTIGYAAPELSIFPQFHTEKVDIWSTGMTLYTIHSPRSGDKNQTLGDLTELAKKSRARSLSKSDPMFKDWTGDFELLKVMIAYDPAERISSTELMALLSVSKTRR